ncbi:hypothetical protein ES704_03659 [subsurface metagenome]|jgi:hypothetical protein
MGANAITVYQENTRTIKCTVTGLDDLVDYAATLTVKKTHNEDAIITKNTDIEGEGEISDLVITFNLTPEDTKLYPCKYVYDITITDETNTYTIVQDIFEVKDSVKY